MTRIFILESENKQMETWIFRFRAQESMLSTNRISFAISVMAAPLLERLIPDGDSEVMPCEGAAPEDHCV